MSLTSVAALLLKKRIKERKLPLITIPQTGQNELDRTLADLGEHIRLYEGDSKAPLERFVTLSELKQSGLLDTVTKQGFSSISEVLGQTVKPANNSTNDAARIIIDSVGANTLSELSDAEIEGAVSDDFFVFDGANWINHSLFNQEIVNWTGTHRFNSGHIEFLERVAAPVAIAGRGYLYLKQATPNTLWFVDDAGTETQIGGGGGGSDTPWTENHDAAGFNLTDVGTLGIYDAGATDKLEVSHDGTDVNFASTNTAKVHFTGNTNFEVESQGIFENLLKVKDDTITAAVPPTTEAMSAKIQITDVIGATMFQMGYGGSNTLSFQNQMEGGVVQFYGTATGGGLKKIFEANPNGSALFYDTGNITLATDANGIYVKAGSGSNSLIEMKTSANARTTYIQSHTTGLRIVNEVHGGDIDFWSEDAGGSVITMLTLDPDALSADFNGNALTSIGAITATSYDGVAAANLVDKTAAEAISGVFTHSVAVNLSDGVDQLSMRTIAGVCTFQPTGGMSLLDLNISVRTNALEAQGAITGTSFGGITSANLLDKSATETVSGLWTFSQQSSVFGGVTASNLVDKSGAEVITGNWSVQSNILAKTASYTLVLLDAGITVRFTGSTASKVLTIPANSSVSYPVGTMIGITNNGTVNMTVVITTDTLTWNKDNTTGTRTLAPGAELIIHKVTTTGWNCGGSALVT